MCKADTASFATVAPISNIARDLLTRTSPLAASALDGVELHLSTATTVELAAGSEMYGLVSAFLAKQTNTRSFVFEIGKGGACDEEDDEDNDNVQRAAIPSLGLGQFCFTFEGKQIWALHQTVGEVVGSDCGATLLQNLVLISPQPGDVGLLQAFCDRLIAEADSTHARKFTVYRFHVKHSYWRRCEVVTAREVNSVVLPAALKSKVVDDIDDFVARDTRAWYFEHGIPYKRAYLFHGAPGAGKTSLIQAIAGRFKRNVCYLGCLTHPDMNDDALKEAMNRVPNKSIIVLEDIDALFSGRVKKAGDKSALTFSGVLNALDGVGGCSGQIFIMTTNHRERLDPALIRNGRVDVHVEFTDATKEQMEGLFEQFYKDAPPERATEFANALIATLGDKTVSCAALQHYFILQRKASAQEAIANVATVLDEAEAHGQTMNTKVGEASKEEAEAKVSKEEETKVEASKVEVEAADGFEEE